MSGLRFLTVAAVVLLMVTAAGHPEIEHPSYIGNSPHVESEQTCRAKTSDAQAVASSDTHSESATSVPADQEPHFEDKVTDLPRVHTLTLEEAINRALEANRGILDARDGIERTRLSIVSAESEFELKIFPLAEAGFTGNKHEDTEERYGTGISVQKKFSTGTIVTLEPNLQKTEDAYETSVDSILSQPLLRGLDQEFNLSGVHGAEFSARSAGRALYLTRVDAVLSTVRAVYAVIRQRELMRVNEESFSRLNHHAEAARVKEKFGLATPIDVYRAEIESKQSEDNLARVREAYKDAKDVLKVILDFPMGEDIDVTAPLEYSVIHMDEKQAVDTALRHRVELRGAWDAVKEAERRSRVARHRILPELNVILSFAPFGSSEDFGAELNDYVWGISLASSTDIRRTEERAAYDQSMLDVDAAYRRFDLLHDEVARETKSALRALHEAEQRIGIQKEQIEKAESKLRLAQIKFKHGMANNFDLIEAEEQLRQAQTNMISLVIDYIVGTYSVRAAIGTLLEQEAGL